MFRREFIKASFGSTLASVSEPNRLESYVIQGGEKRREQFTPRILASYTHEDHRRRLLNIARCENSIRKCLRKHLITDYLPGQALYLLGEYPCRKPWDPDEYDEQQLEQLSNEGIQLIQVMEDWNDLLRLFGGDKFTAVNPPGLHRFIDMVHKRGMKIILYASTGHFQATDPDFRQEWARPGYSTQAAHWQLVQCSAASAGWRAYMLPRTLRIMEEYDIDGLYNDAGSRRLSRDPELATSDEVLAFEESAQRDGALEDLLSIIYSEVKRRGGIYKIHLHDVQFPNTEKLWDYLWVGEGVGNADQLRKKTKNHPPYVVPCFDWRYGELESEDQMYVQTIPYMQFPLLQAGRPFTGERAVIPGVKYYPHRLLDDWRKRWEYHQAHPQGPYSYGPWDSFPDKARPNARRTHAAWLKQYYSLVETGTWAYLEVEETDLLASPMPAGIVASLFANLQIYLVLANFGESPAQVQTTDAFVATNQKLTRSERNWTVSPRSLLILRRA